MRQVKTVSGPMEVVNQLLAEHGSVLVEEIGPKYMHLIFVESEGPTLICGQEVAEVLRKEYEVDPGTRVFRIEEPRQ